MNNTIKLSLVPESIDSGTIFSALSISQNKNGLPRSVLVPVVPILSCEKVGGNSQNVGCSRKNVGGNF